VVAVPATDAGVTIAKTGATVLWSVRYRWQAGCPRQTFPFSSGRSIAWR